MARGGARVRSGPAKDPKSRTSERAKYVPTALPSEGFAGEVPDLTEFQPDASARELSLWKMYWRTPQACMWSTSLTDQFAVVDLVVARARAEEPKAAATLWNTVKALRDELGLTKEGLERRGWAIVVDEVGAKAAEKAEDEKKPAAKKTSRNRLKAVKASGA